MCFVMTKISLSQQNVCHNNKNVCCDKRTSVMTKHLVFVMAKMILLAVPTNDSGLVSGGAIMHSWWLDVCSAFLTSASMVCSLICMISFQFCMICFFSPLVPVKQCVMCVMDNESDFYT